MDRENSIEYIYGELLNTLDKLEYDLLKNDQYRLDEKALNIIYDLRDSLNSFMTRYEKMNNIGAMNNGIFEDDGVVIDTTTIAVKYCTMETKRLAVKLEDIKSKIAELKEHFGVDSGIDGGEE